MNYYKDIKYIK